MGYYPTPGNVLRRLTLAISPASRSWAAQKLFSTPIRGVERMLADAARAVPSFALRHRDRTGNSAGRLGLAHGEPDTTKVRGRRRRSVIGSHTNIAGVLIRLENGRSGFRTRQSMPLQYGARGGIRTRTSFRKPNFKSGASTTFRHPGALLSECGFRILEG